MRIHIRRWTKQSFYLIKKCLINYLRLYADKADKKCKKRLILERFVVECVFVSGCPRSKRPSQSLEALV